MALTSDSLARGSWQMFLILGLPLQTRGPCKSRDGPGSPRGVDTRNVHLCLGNYSILLT